MAKTVRFAGICLLLTLVVSALLPVTAYATPQTHPNTYVNTGDQRADIIGVALTQVGYLEGENNDTKYGVWYGYNHLAWCGIFVAWCANQAGVPTSVLPKTGVSSPAAYGLTTKPDGYIPLSGDLFFARDNSHVGLVYYVDGDYFYSLEGNTCENGPDGVYIRRHKISNVVFASPAYQGGGSHTYVLGSETAHPHKEYYRCTDCGDQYYTGKTVQRTDCTTCIQDSCSHSYGSWAKMSDSLHTRTCSKCGKTESANHSWNSGTVIQAATCATDGTKNQTCTACAATSTAVISKTGSHIYTDWEPTGEQTHERSCTVCSLKESGVHDLSEWESDEDHHWRICKSCGLKLEAQTHQFGDACDSPCEICQYARPDGHQFRSEWCTDSDAHWQVCDVCGLKREEGEHSFDADCDESCFACGFLRQTKHTYTDVWQTNAQDHWHVCTVCGQVKDVQSHVSETVSREGAVQYCTVCAAVLTSEAEHTHGYDTFFSDESGHWGTCSCGLTMELEAHQWSVRTELCSVCGQAKPSRQTDYSDLLPWIAGLVSILAGGAVPIGLLLRKKK